MVLPVFDTQFETGLSKKLTAAMDDIAATVVGGKCPDHTEYRYDCGRMEGISIALELMYEVRHELLGRGEKDAA